MSSIEDHRLFYANFVGRRLAACAPAPGESVVHIGAGTQNLGCARKMKHPSPSYYFVD